MSASALAVTAVLLFAVAAAAPEGETTAPCTRRPVVFAFGDSNTDTGGIAAALGNYFPLPEGRTHFRRSTGRLCDGRLVIDYLCKWRTYVRVQIYASFAIALASWAVVRGCSWPVSSCPEHAALVLSFSTSRILCISCAFILRFNS